MRKWIIMVMAIVLIIPVGQAFAADTTKGVKVSFAPIHYVVDGVDYAPPEGVLGFINHDTSSTYVPLRFVGTILNKTVKWDAAQSKVTLGTPESSDLQGISDYLAANKSNNPIVAIDKSKVTSTTIQVSLKEVNYEFDGQTVKPDAKTPGFIYNGSIYVPLRFVYVSNGFSPKWDSATYSITTETPPYLPTKNAIAKKIRSCTSEVTTKGLAFYMSRNSMTPEEVQASIVDVDKMIADCRAELEILLVEMTTQLTAAGESTAIVDQFRKEMDSLEAKANDFIKQYRK